jgi:hypothetical protein
VIQIRNNYDKGAAGVFNGTVGTITALSVTDQQLTVRTDEDEDIDYDFDELDELQHAYAITVHRSQGSEYPAVVVPLTMSAYTLLQRNLLYTAVTRAKRLVVLAGSRKALAIAVRTAGTGRKFGIPPFVIPWALGAVVVASPAAARRTPAARRAAVTVGPRVLGDDGKCLGENRGTTG